MCAIRFHDVLSSEDWALAMVPKPVKPVVFLYPINDVVRNHPTPFPQPSMTYTPPSFCSKRHTESKKLLSSPPMDKRYLIYLFIYLFL